MDVFLADDHAIFLAGLRSVIGGAPDLKIVGEASRGDDALAQLASLRPRVAVLDIEMPGLTGIEVTRKLRDDHVHTAVILISVHHERSFVEAALEAGISGYLVKEDASNELLDAIRAAGRGELFLSPRVASLALQVARQQADAPHLTARERDIVRLLSEGLSSKAIAAELSLTSKTIDGYRSAIMTKLSIHSVAGLVRYAIRNHLTRVEG